MKVAEAKTPEQIEKEKAEAEKVKKQQESLKTQAGKRVPKALEAVDSLGSLAIHKPTPAQVDAIVSAVQKKLDSVKRELLAGGRATPSFQLPD